MYGVKGGGGTGKGREDARVDILMGFLEKRICEFMGVNIRPV